MEALIELCDLVAQNPSLFSEKLAWICSRCPPSTPSFRLTRSHLNAILATARFLSKCPYQKDEENNTTNANTPRDPKSAILDFLRSIPSSFNASFWPLSFSPDAISSFFSDLLPYVAKAAELSPDFASEAGAVIADVVITASARSSDADGIARVFLTALSRNCPPLPSREADRLVGCLLEQFLQAEGAAASVSGSVSSLQILPSLSSETASSSSQSSPMGVRQHQHLQPNGDGSPVSEASVSSSNSALAMPSALSKGKEESVDDDGGGTGESSKGSVARPSVGNGTAGPVDGPLRQQVSAFEEESVEGLEKQEIAFRLFVHVLDKVSVKAGNLEQVRTASAKQLKSLPAFLKIRKRDWTEQGALLKARINTKLSACQAAASVQIKSLLSLDFDGKAAKLMLRGTLALLLDAAEACILSSWRKLSICEELFSSLLNGIAQVAVTRGGQLLRVLLIRLKPLVLTTCAQADTWGNNQGAMFESVTKTSCEIIEFGWSKDRAPVDTFIMGLAASIRERNDYEDQEGKEKQGIPVVQLNVIRLLAELSVSVNKCEVVDMILPLFIESLEEGDASSPSLLRLRVWNFTF